MGTEIIHFALEWFTRIICLNRMEHCTEWWTPFWFRVAIIARKRSHPTTEWKRELYCAPYYTCRHTTKVECGWWWAEHIMSSVFNQLQ